MSGAASPPPLPPPPPPPGPWLAGERAPERAGEGAPLEGKVEADVAIVGGGITGVATAYFLASSSFRTVLVEAGDLAGGASGRNAGLVLTGLADHYNRLARGIGRTAARSVWAYTADNGRLIREAVEKHRIDCGYDACGSYVLATFKAEQDDLAESHEWMREDRLLGPQGPLGAVELLSKTGLGERSRAPRGLAALFQPRDAAVDPAALVRGLARHLGPSVRIHERTEVIGLSVTSDGVELATPRGRLRAHVAVIATNAAAARLHAFFEDRIWAVRGQGFVTDPVDARVLDAGVTASWGHEYYRQLEDGRILAAGVNPDPRDDEMGFDLSPTGECQGFLQRFRAHRVPAAPADLPIRTRFAGTTAFSADGVPLVGPIPGQSGLLCACGYTMRGLSLGMAAGRSLARLIEDGRRDYPASFSLSRFLGAS